MSEPIQADRVAYEPSTLEFSLSQKRLMVSGRAALREDLQRFITQLTVLLPFMPDAIANAIEAGDHHITNVTQRDR